MPTHRWLLLLGSNLPGPARVQQAFARLALLGHVTPLTAIERMPARSDLSHFYYNALAALVCDLDPESLRAQLKRIEMELGRVHDGSGIVAIDIDLLALHANGRWRADPHAIEKNEFTQTPARELIAAAGILIGDRS